MNHTDIIRKVDQKISIGDDICITVVEIMSSKKVRLGISAPDNFNICRKEIVENVDSQES